MKDEFSHRTRAEDLARMQEGVLDLLVVGGGIVGAGVARDAASRGLRTALVERGDFASGTSGKTSRLVHGGLRYLRNYRLGLVRLAARERDRLVVHAPGLVHPLPFLLPAYADRGPGPSLLRFGLFLYDALSTHALPRRAWLTAEATRAREPRLRSRGLRGAGMYHDAWTDDARFVLSVVRDAAHLGAHVANYVEVEDFLRSDDNRVRGARARDRFGTDPIELRAQAVVNATGVRLDGLRIPRSIATIRPTKGIHLFLPRAMVGNRHAIALTTRRDSRIVFVLPWNDLTLVGTTDTDYAGDPDDVVPDPDDVAYLLEAVNDAFPDAHATPQDVVSAYAGLRPLVRRGRSDRSESDASREHALFVDRDGLISVAGGKLTTHRAMAEDVVNAVAVRLGSVERSRTSERPLGPASGPLEDYIALGLDEDAALRLRGRFAVETVRRHIAAPLARNRIAANHPAVWVEVEIAVREEMAMALTDVLVRRTGLFYEAADQGLDAARDVATRMGTLLGWEPGSLEQEVEAYRSLVRAHCAFRMDGGR